MCNRCKTNPVITLTNTNISLCKTCFVRYFEKKALKTIRKYNLIERRDKIGIACSGGKDSLALLYFLNKVAEKKCDLDLTVIKIDEGVKGYSTKNLEPVKKFCDANNIKLKTSSYKEEFGFKLDKIVKHMKENPCSICGILKRSILNKKARELKLKKLATGHNLDDEAQAILMNQFKRNIETSARLGPITGIVSHPKFVRRIKPFYLLEEREVALYAKLKNLKTETEICPHRVDSYRLEVKKMLNNFEKKYPGTKYAIINSYLEIMPLLKEKYKTNKRINTCKKCKEPCSQEICRVCSLINKIKQLNL